MRNDVASLRKSYGLDHAVLADLCGVSLSTAYRWEAFPDRPIDNASRRVILVMRSLMPISRRRNIGKQLDEMTRARGGLFALHALLSLYFGELS